MHSVIFSVNYFGCEYSKAMLQAFRFLRK